MTGSCISSSHFCSDKTRHRFNSCPTSLLHAGSLGSCIWNIKVTDVVAWHIPGLDMWSCSHAAHACGLYSNVKTPSISDKEKSAKIAAQETLHKAYTYTSDSVIIEVQSHVKRFSLHDMIMPALMGMIGQEYKCAGSIYRPGFTPALRWPPRLQQLKV